MKHLWQVALLSLLLVGWGCSGSDSNSNSGGSSSAQTEQTGDSGLSSFEQEHGIGPVKEEMELGPIDEKLAMEGKELFKTNCSACHKMDERYVGPAQRDVVEQRSPEYIMNMILNPAEMVEKHPEAKKMLAEFMTPMPNQNLSREEARAILEYFRYANEQGTEQEEG